jgi:hypothetical protein
MEEAREQPHGAGCSSAGKDRKGGSGKLRSRSGHSDIINLKLFYLEFSMSTKASIASGENFHLYNEVLLSEDPRSVFLTLESPLSFELSKETYRGKVIESLTAEIPASAMDDIAIAWIKHRKLQGALGGPVGQEWGSPDCEWQ